MGRRIRDGGMTPVGVDFVSSFEYRFNGQGLVATDGVQRTGVVTFGTTATAIINQLVDPGLNLSLQAVYVGLTQRFSEVASVNGTLNYYWQARVNMNGSAHSWLNLSPTYAKGINALANSEDTLSGYVDVGSLPNAPFDIRLMAVGLIDSSMTGAVKNSSRIQYVGQAIPGT